MKIRAAAFLVLFALAPIFAHAADLTVSWTNATTYTDGSPMPASDLVSTTAWCGLSASSLTLSATATAPATSVVVKGALAGQPYVCGAAHTSKSNGTSAMSMLSSGVSVPLPKPGPPTGVTAVVVAATAYEIRPNSSGVLAATRIGVIPLGSPCQTDTRTVGAVMYNRVDPSSVDLINWPTKIPPADVFALCSAAG